MRRIYKLSSRVIFSLCLIYGSFAMSETLQGICVLEGSVGYEAIFGEIQFSQEVLNGKDVMVVNGTINNAPTGWHDFFVHEWGDIREGEGEYIGRRWNPHQLTNCTNSIMEDIESKKVYSQGTFAFYGKVLAKMELIGENSIIGRSLVLHQSRSSCPSEEKTKSLAQCVIGIKNTHSIYKTSQNHDGPLNTSCYLTSTVNSTNIYGIVSIIMNGTVSVFGSISGLQQQEYKLLIHQYGDLRGFDDSQVGQVLFPVVSSLAGVVNDVTQFDGRLNLDSDIVGKAMVLYQVTDSKPVGNCIIGITNNNPFQHTISTGDLLMESSSMDTGMTKGMFIVVTLFTCIGLVLTIYVITRTLYKRLLENRRGYLKSLRSSEDNIVLNME